MNIPIKRILADAALLSVSVAAVVGSLAYAAQSGALDFSTPDHDVSLSLMCGDDPCVPEPKTTLELSGYHGYPPCTHEDSTDVTCEWDATEHNGEGRSYILFPDGATLYFLGEV